MTLLGVNPPRKLVHADPALHPAQGALNASTGCAQRVALPIQPWPTAGRRLPATAGPRLGLQQARGGWGGGKTRPIGGAADPGSAAPSAHPESAAARRAPRECTARRAARREARRGLQGGSGRDPPPLPAWIPWGA